MHLLGSGVRMKKLGEGGWQRLSDTRVSPCVFDRGCFDFGAPTGIAGAMKNAQPKQNPFPAHCEAGRDTRLVPEADAIGRCEEGVDFQIRQAFFFMSAAFSPAWLTESRRCSPRYFGSCRVNFR